MSEIDNNPFAEPVNENPFKVSALFKVYLGLTASDDVKQQLTQKTCRVCVEGGTYCRCPVCHLLMTA